MFFLAEARVGVQLSPFPRCYGGGGAPLEPLSTAQRRRARRRGARRRRVLARKKPPALQRGSPGGSAGGLGTARRGRLGSQNTKTRPAPAATLRLVGFFSASRRVIEFLGAQLPFWGSEKRVLRANGIGAHGPSTQASVLARPYRRYFIALYLVLWLVCAHARSSRYTANSHSTALSLCHAVVAPNFQ